MPLAFENMALSKRNKLTHTTSICWICSREILKGDSEVVFEHSTHRKKKHVHEECAVLLRDGLSITLN